MKSKERILEEKRKEHLKKVRVPAGVFTLDTLERIEEAFENHRKKEREKEEEEKLEELLDQLPKKEDWRRRESLRSNASGLGNAIGERRKSILDRLRGPYVPKQDRVIEEKQWANCFDRSLLGKQNRKNAEKSKMESFLGRNQQEKLERSFNFKRNSMGNGKGSDILAGKVEESSSQNDKNKVIWETIGNKRLMGELRLTPETVLSKETIQEQFECILKALESQFQRDLAAFSKKEKRREKKREEESEAKANSTQKAFGEERDLLGWLKLNTVFQFLKKNLKKRVVELLNDPANRQAIENAVSFQRKTQSDEKFVVARRFSVSMMAFQPISSIPKKKIPNNAAPQPNPNESLLASSKNHQDGEKQKPIGETRIDSLKNIRMRKESICYNKISETHQRAISVPEETHKEVQSETRKETTSEIAHGEEIKGLQVNEMKLEELKLRVSKSKKIDIRWNEQKEQEMLQKKKKAKELLFSFVPSSSFNSLALSEFIQEARKAESKKDLRTFLLDQLMGGEFLTEDEINFLDVTSEYNVIFADKKKVQEIINLLDHDVIDSIETEIADNIIESYSRIQRLILAERAAFLKEKLKENEKIQKEKEGIFKAKQEKAARRSNFGKEFLKEKIKAKFISEEYEASLQGSFRPKLNEINKGLGVSSKENNSISSEKQQNNKKKSRFQPPFGDFQAFLSSLKKPATKNERNEKGLEKEKMIRSASTGRILKDSELKRLIHPNSRIFVKTTSTGVQNEAKEMEDKKYLMEITRIRQKKSLDKSRFKEAYSMGPNAHGHFGKSEREKEKSVLLIQKIYKGFVVFRHFKMIKRKIQDNKPLSSWNVTQREKARVFRQFFYEGVRTVGTIFGLVESPKKPKKRTEGSLGIGRNSQMSQRHLNMSRNQNESFSFLIGHESLSNQTSERKKLNECFGNLNSSRQESKGKPSAFRVDPHPRKERTVSAANASSMSMGLKAKGEKESKENGQLSWLEIQRIESQMRERNKSKLFMRAKNEALRTRSLTGENEKKRSRERRKTVVHQNLVKRNTMINKKLMNQRIQEKRETIFKIVKHADLNKIMKRGGANFLQSDLNFKDQEGNVPLYYAAQLGKLSLCDFLLEHGADPNVPCANGDTPVHMAFKTNRVEMILLFLNNGANLHIANRAGQFPVGLIPIFLQETLNLALKASVVQKGIDSTMAQRHNEKGGRNETSEMLNEKSKDKGGSYQEKETLGSNETKSKEKLTNRASLHQETQDISFNNQGETAQRKGEVATKAFHLKIPMKNLEELANKPENKYGLVAYNPSTKATKTCSSASSSFFH